MKGRTEKSFLSIGGVLVLVGIWLLLNGIGKYALGAMYLDLTEEGLYSLSESSKRIVASIKTPITLKLYISRTEGAQFPLIERYGSRIEDLLREFERAADGKLVLEFFDPRTDSEEAEWAHKFGLAPIPSPTGEQLFLGMVGVSSAGDEQVIEMFQFNRQEFLEYDIAKLVYSLLDNKKPVVALFSPLEIRGQAMSPLAQLQGQSNQQPPWFFTTQLETMADVRYLEPPVTEIGADVDVLMLVYPKDLPEQLLFAIDQFVLSGGKLLLFTDAFCQMDPGAASPENPAAAMTADRSSNLNSLIKKWGIEQLDKKSAADMDLATKVSTARGAPEKSFVSWLSLRSSQLNKKDVVTSSLDHILLPWPGVLQLLEVEGVTTEVLLHTSKNAALLEESEYRFGGGSPEALLRNYKKGGEELVLAAKAYGKFKTNFPEGRPGQGSDAPMSESMLTESTEVSHIVVIADTDMLADGFSVASQSVFGRRFVSLLNDNLSFVQNLVENLTGSNDLISIRSRGKFSRPFTKVQEIEKNAQDEWRTEESKLQTKLNAANQRLTQLQSSAQSSQQGGAQQVFTMAVLQEIKNARGEKLAAQKRLREVRRKLRQDTEELGLTLFALNAFGVPLLLIIGSLSFVAIRKKIQKSEE